MTAGAIPPNFLMCIGPSRPYLSPRTGSRRVVDDIV